MIVWGPGADSVDFGVAETRYCATCEKERLFRLVLNYRYWGFYWIFNRVTSKQYALVCDICERGWEVDAAEFEAHLGIVPIPFMRRYGLAVFGGIFALLMVFSFSRSMR